MARGLPDVQRAWESVLVTQDSGDGLADTTGRWRPTATEVVAQRVRDLRTRHGWTAEQLADECAKAGAEQLNRSVLANLESGRRKFVTLDEVIALAYVLDVAPVHLLVPTSEVVDHRKFGRVLVDGYRLTDKLSADSLQRARAWIKGEAALPGVDRRMYDAERPEGDPHPPNAADVIAYLQALNAPTDEA